MDVEPTLHHIKVHFNLKHLPDVSDKLSQLICSEHTTIRRQEIGESYVVFLFHGRPYVFTAFYKGFINVVRLKSLQDVDHVVDLLSLHLNIAQYEIRDAFAIDNMTATIEMPAILNLQHVQSIAQSFPNVAFSRYNPTRFSACNVKTAFGSLLIFSNGKCVLIGCKSFAAVKLVRDIYKEIIARASKE